MKRRTIHLVFGVLSLCCVGVACERGLRLHRTAGLNTEIARQQNFPLTIHERVPRRDHGAAFYIAAMLCCAGLLACRAVQLQSWRKNA